MRRNILIVGQGTAGRALARDISATAQGTVVGFLDDREGGGDVLGRLADVNRVVVAHDVDLVYFAIPSAEAATVRDFISSIELRSIEIAIVPRTYAILTKETVAVDDLTDVDVLDLVGRSPVKHDLEESRRFLAGKRVLITGAAGSIGSRLVRQVASMGALQVTGVDWWENGVFGIAHDLKDLDRVSFVIADVKNETRMRQVFAEYRPEVVFHAAAYKHVPLMQDNPAEALTNNVGGSITMMELARDHGASHFVLVSTDKAVNPANVMGASKRLAEQAMQAFAAAGSGTRYNAVRFGNVIESNGSVMQTFRRQIRAGVNLTVTDREVTRFFMTIDEATQLIVQSAFVGTSGDLFVLDMGEPVRIYDLAESLIATVDPTLSIDIIGLRPGEKMFEELTYEPDRVTRTRNAKIYVVQEESLPDPSQRLRTIRGLVSRAASDALGVVSLIEEIDALGFDVSTRASARPASDRVLRTAGVAD